MTYREIYGSSARTLVEVGLSPPLSLLWSFGAPSAPTGSFPIVSSGSVVLWSTEELVGLNPEGGEVWQNRGNFAGGHSLCGDVIIVVRGDPFDKKNRGGGPKEWQRVSTQTGESASLGSADRSLVALVGATGVCKEHVVVDERVVSSLSAVSVGEAAVRQLWRRQSESGSSVDVYSLDLAVADGRIFVGFRPDIIAVDLHTGDRLWKSPVDDLGGNLTLDAFPMVIQGVCVVATKAWTAAFDAKTGKRLWSTPIWGSRVVYGDRVYVIQDDTLYAFDLFDGSVKVQYNLRSEMEKKGKKKFDRISSHIAASDTHVWAGDPYGTLWALNRETGRPEWHHRPKGTTGYSGGVPAISGNRLYIPSFSMDPRFPPSLYCYEKA